MNIEKYDYHVTWSEEDQLFIGRVTEFPSLAAHGETLVAALEEIHQVVSFVVEDLEASNELIPEPFCKRRFSGKVNLRMSENLHRRLVLEAARSHQSLNQTMIEKLTINNANNAILVKK